jgi:hypothetical protein
VNPFDPKAKCAKCRCDDVATTFHEKGTHKDGIGDCEWLWARDTLVRRCKRCGYEWNEVPLDAKKEADRGKK